MRIKIAPSLLSADYSKLTEEIVRMEEVGADLIHWDIMDTCYVSTDNFSAELIKENREKAKILFDVHLMICKPEERVDEFIEAGANYLSFHVEACEKPKKLIQKIKESGVKVGLAVNANVEIESVYSFLEEIDFVLVMAVQAGKGGQAFKPETLEKIKELKKEVDAKGLSLEIEVDGGMNPEIAKQCIQAGANIIVSGSTIFKSDNPKETIEKLRE